jgi:hypothetical protein
LFVRRTCTALDRARFGANQFFRYVGVQIER